MSKAQLRPKILNEGYCCIYGYLNLCKARGETIKSMAAFLGVNKSVLWDCTRKKGKKHVCQQTSECLQPIILEIQKEKGP